MKRAAVVLGAVALAALLVRGGSTSSTSSTATPRPPPAAGELDPAAVVAMAEAQRWAGLVETDAAAAPLLREYWAAAGQAYPGPEAPWSGAFVQWVIRQTRPGSLPVSAKHFTYTAAAARNVGSLGRYGAFDASTMTPAPGDIIIRGRGAPLMTWADVADPAGRTFDGHGDVVVSRSGDSIAVVGGNVDQSVKLRTIALDAAGRAPGVVAVLRYQPRRLA